MLSSLPPVAFVHVTDAVRARAFYVDVLGLEFVEDSPFALVLRSGPTMIRVTPVADHRAVGGTVLGWDTPDIAAEIDELSARGVTMLRFDGLEQDDRGIWQSPSTAQVAWFADPDGNTLSLTQF